MRHLSTPPGPRNRLPLPHVRQDSSSSAEPPEHPIDPIRPLLYLDVDGVLNPVCPDPRGDFTLHRIHGCAVLISARHAAWLRELADVYELAWASTWESHANSAIAPLLGLPALPVVPLRGGSAGGAGGDWLPILRHAAGRPFAWVDDLVPPAVVRSCAGRGDRLVLTVDPGQGLRRAHVDRLLRRPPQPVGSEALTPPRRG